MNKLKQTIAENGGFKHWFVNVFWYHYRWPLLIAVVIVGIVGFITWDALRQERYDTTVVLATDYYVDDENLTALEELFEGCTEDYDGNGKVNVCVINLFVGNTEVGRQNQERMYLYMTQDDVALFLMSEDVAEAYTNPQLEYFVDPLEDYDLPCDEDNEVCYTLTGNSLLESCGITSVAAALMDHGAGSEARNAVEAACAMLNALINVEKN